ncbi:polyribonucleotide nucleotidyltransferase [Desulfobotulus alkaliphilus]|uniref:Polyribonucleotide nucleotidyltransferase n=1 Tax=Desulfobotulus alkaliphilus TaxID=622671 RepID=A0A562RAG9_9BACT|nr:polyribonucleotide nucleotidyltransferase [Desulfobotulus alkaliphilus]TWI66048.1 polyribonucleotide nucleotidyltransferase [Desulfobotulus alkaliphilus]
MQSTFSADIDGKTISISTGKIAKQASGTAIVQCGETVVMVTAVSSSEERDIDFLPLTVEYQEKIYAAGRIPGNYFRREMGRPSEKEILTCRLIDRPIRPLFPKGYSSEIQIIATVLSMDKENDPDILAIIGTSAALTISDIPFEGPIAGIRVARINNRFVFNPTLSDLKTPGCDMNIVLAGSRTGIVMVEGGTDFVSEADVLDAIFSGHEAMQPLIRIQEQLQEAAGKAKRSFTPPVVDEELAARIYELAAAPLAEALKVDDKMVRKANASAVKKQLLESLGEEGAERKNEVMSLFDSLMKKVSRKIVLEEGTRVDGRAFDEVRPIRCEVGTLPRPHGSALFTRGETQVLGVLTLGSGRDEQRIETLSGDESKPFMLHYNFPPYCVGEVKRVGSPSRREFGHGALATRAIEPILPNTEDFEYTIRLVSEVTESNGSSSMGTVCAGTLALMDGGVPIKAPVSGIAMGLVKEGDQVVVLSDILGDEDHTGDMDFKVAGGEAGITSIQMDIKITELSRDIMEKALAQAKEGRQHILKEMLAAIPQTRDALSPYAPKVFTIKINPDKIRDLIGPGGKMIRAIQADTHCDLNVDDSGTVKISAANLEDAEAAKKLVLEICMEPEVGEIYTGKVVRTTDFGAFVQLKPGTDGLVHISELAHHRVKKVTDVVNEGEDLQVKVLEISRDGKIRLSHKALLEPPAGAPADSGNGNSERPRRDDSNSSRPPRR